MLIDDIQKTIKQLKQLDVLEAAVQDAEKKAKNDSDFSALVTDLSVAMNKLSYATKEFDFTLSEETTQYVEETIEKLEDAITAGVVDEEELAAAKQHINRKVTPGLTKEWKSFHQQKTSGIIGKLATIGGLVADRDTISAIRSSISNGSDWSGLSLKDDGVNTRLQLLKNSIKEVDRIEDNLNLSDKFKDFVILVTQGKAKVTDLDSDIINWIKNEHLEDKFIINFNNI